MYNISHTEMHTFLHDTLSPNSAQWCQWGFQCLQLLISPTWSFYEGVMCSIKVECRLASLNIAQFTDICADITAQSSEYNVLSIIHRKKKNDTKMLVQLQDQTQMYMLYIFCIYISRMHTRFVLLLSIKISESVYVSIIKCRKLFCKFIRKLVLLFSDSYNSFFKHMWRITTTDILCWPDL